LKTFQDQRSLSADQEANLSVWDEKLAEPAVKIHQARQSFLHNISPLAQKYYEQISGQAEEFALTYHPSPRLEDYTWENFCRKLFSRRGRELAFGQTMYGPHRDDLALSINNLDAHDAGSQGQIKTAFLSLKLAQFSYLQNRLERPPILLLDEIFSDLDSQRLSFIMNLFPSFGQVFITTSKLSEINELDLFNCKFELKNGIPTIL